MRSALWLEVSCKNTATRQMLSRQAADSAVKAAQLLLVSQSTPDSAKKPVVKKLPSGQPVVKSATRGHRTHISISHLQKTVAGFAASQSL